MVWKYSSCSLYNTYIYIYVYIAAFRNLPSPAKFAHDNTTMRDFINTAHLVANSNLHFLTSVKPPRISKYDVGGKLMETVVAWLPHRQIAADFS